MSQDLKCLVGVHKYNVFQEEDITLAGTQIIIAKAIISRCENCGKLKTEMVETTSFGY